MTVAVPIKQLSLEQLADQIRLHLDAFDKVEESALVHAERAGKWLKLAKEKCDKGAWSAWCESRFNKTKQMADGYIRIHDHWEEIKAEIEKTGQGMSVRKALAFIAEKHPEPKKPPKKKAKKPLNLTEYQVSRIREYLTNLGVDVDPSLFAQILDDLGLNVERLVGYDGLLEALNKQIVAKKVKEWVATFKDAGLAWAEAASFWGFDPLDTTLAQLAADAEAGVYRWMHHWWRYTEEKYRPPAGYDTIIDAIEGHDYFFVNGQGFDAQEVARKAVEWAVSQEKVPWHMEEETITALRQKLAAMNEQGPITQAQPPVEEPATPPAEGLPEPPAEPGPSTESPQPRSRRRR